MAAVSEGEEEGKQLLPAAAAASEAAAVEAVGVFPTPPKFVQTEWQTTEELLAKL